MHLKLILLVFVVTLVSCVISQRGGGNRGGNGGGNGGANGGANGGGNRGGNGGGNRGDDSGDIGVRNRGDNDNVS